MPRKKLIRLEKLSTAPNYFSVPLSEPPAWAEVFGRTEPMILELGCGHGAYVLELAKRQSDRNLIGVDIKGSRMWTGVRLALEQGIKNAVFLRCPIENLLEYFPSQSISQIWITFPDPHPKPCRADKRLTAPDFLKIYRNLLSPNGKIFLKTDNPVLFDFSLKSFAEEGFVFEEVFFDLHGKDRGKLSENSPFLIETFYEKKHRGLGAKIMALGGRPSVCKQKN